MKSNKLEKLIDRIAGVICRGDPDPVPLTLEPIVKVEPTTPVPVSALEEQSERARPAMEEKRARALCFLAARTLPDSAAAKHRRIGSRRHDPTTALAHL